MVLATVTTDSVPGYEADKTYGLVWACVPVGADHPDLAAAMEHARKMIEADADAMADPGKAAAIVGLRLALTDTQAVAYGTAVRPGPTGQRQARVRPGRVGKPRGF